MRGFKPIHELVYPVPTPQVNHFFFLISFVSIFPILLRQIQKINIKNKILDTDVCLCFETQTYYIAQGGLKLSILLSQSLKCWDYKSMH